MIARVASFEGIDVQAAQDTMDEAEAIIRPLLEGLNGYQGALELVSPDGKFLSITLFDSMENAQAAEPTFDQEMPREARPHLRAVGRAAGSRSTATRSPARTSR